jgi:hypothetical protein
VRLHDKHWLFIDLLDAYGLKNKIIIYVKDEGSNLNTLTNALKFVVKCETLGLKESFKATCFGHVFFRCMPICHK